MSFEIKAEGIDVLKLLADVHARIDERRRTASTPTRSCATSPSGRSRASSPAASCAPTSSTSSAARDAQWNFSFDPDSDLPLEPRRRRAPARSRCAALLRPVQKLFWNPTPMIAALSRQSDLNRFSVHLLHNLVLELSRAEPRGAGAAQPQPAARRPARGARAAREDARGHGRVPRGRGGRTGPRADEGPPAARGAVLRRRDRQRGARDPAPAAGGRPRVGHLRGARPPARRAPRAAAVGVPRGLLAGHRLHLPLLDRQRGRPAHPRARPTGWS